MKIILTNLASLPCQDPTSDLDCLYQFVSQDHDHTILGPNCKLDNHYNKENMRVRVYLLYWLTQFQPNTNLIDDNELLKIST